MDVKKAVRGQTAIGTVRAAIGTVKTAKGTVRTAIGTVRAAIGTVRTAIGTVRAAIGTVRAAIGTVRAAIGTVKTAIGTVRTAIGALHYRCGQSTAGCRLEHTNRAVLIALHHTPGQVQVHHLLQGAVYVQQDGLWCHDHREPVPAIQWLQQGVVKGQLQVTQGAARVEGDIDAIKTEVQGDGEFHTFWARQVEKGKPICPRRQLEL